MNCKSMRMLLLDYLDDNLSTDLQNDVSEHLETCPGCSAYFSRFGKLPDIMAVDKQFQADPFMYTRIASKLDNKIQQGIRLKPAFRTLIIAFTMLTGIYSGIWLGKSYNNKKTIAADYQEEVYYLNEFQRGDMITVLLSD